jgi:hypothetical protein
MGAQPYATVCAADLANATAPLRWIAQGLFLESGAGILGGAPKSGKSFLALELCVSIASGTACMGQFPIQAPGPVTLLCVEDPPAVVLQRLQALARAHNTTLESLPIHVIVEPAVRLPDGIERLRATLDKTQPRLLLLDPLIRLHRADENSAAEMSVILDGIRALARTSHTAILLVHHTRKAAAGSSAGSALRGSSDLHAFGDTNLYLRKLDRDGLELRIEHRACACPPPLRLRMTVDDGDEPIARIRVSDGHDREDPLARKLLAALRASDCPLSSRTLRSNLGVRNQFLSEALQELLHQGRIQRIGREGWAAADPASQQPLPVPSPICQEPEPIGRQQISLPLGSRAETIAPEQRGGPPPGDGSSSDGSGARASPVPPKQPEDDCPEPGGGRGEGAAEGQSPCSRQPPGDAQQAKDSPTTCNPVAPPTASPKRASIAGRGRVGTGAPLPSAHKH